MPTLSVRDGAHGPIWHVPNGPGARYAYSKIAPVGRRDGTGAWVLANGARVRT